MKRIITHCKQVPMVLLLMVACVVGQTVQAQTPLELLGGNTLAQETANGPYLITSESDWNNLAEYVKAGNTCAGLNFKLTNDISISTTLGYQTTANKNSRKYFAGNFDGNNKTLDVTLSPENYADPEHRYCSPFAFFSGSTIQNLNVTGTITTDGQFAAGLCGSALHPITISNCHVSVSITSLMDNTINSSKNGNHGGILGIAEQGSVFTDCWFDGKFLGDNFKAAGGFVGLNKGQATLNNCFFKPSEIGSSVNFGSEQSKNQSFTIVHWAQDIVIPYFTNVYYLIEGEEFGVVQGVRVYVDEPAEPHGTVTCVDGNSYYYLKSPAWAALQAALDAGQSPIDLTADVVAATSDQPLVVPTGKNITLNLNGFTINRNLNISVDNGYVLKVESGATLTVTGLNNNNQKGIIKGGYNVTDGGGIYNEGNLSLSNLTISGNKTVTKGGGIYNAAGAVLSLNGVIVNGNKTIHNNPGYGAGIYVDGGNVTLNGCTISSNEGENQGGGIYINSGTVYANNSKITGNKAKAHNTGGGVYLKGGSFTLENGSITGNLGTKDNQNLMKGAGVFVESNATFQLVGNPNISTNHHAKDNNVISNVCLAETQVIDVTNMGTTAEIGVSMGHPGTFTTGLDEQPLSIFTSDVTDYSIGKDKNGEAILGIPLTVEFASYDGSTMADFQFIQGSGLTLPVCTYVTPTGEVFDGWNTATDFSGTFYDDEASTDGITESLILYPLICPSINLDNDADDNTDELTTNTLARVTLTNRTLLKTGVWNTLCLPFNLTLEGSILEGAIAKTMDNAEMTGNHVDITFTEPVETLQAGVPYIIKWTEGENIVNPVFRHVFVTKNSEPDPIVSTDGCVEFHGYYNAFNIDASNVDIYYMTSNNALQRTAKARTLKACRAYFRFTPNNGGDVKALDFSIDFGGDVPTVINSINDYSDLKVVNVYDLSGRRVQQPSKGMYIVNGKKVFIQ